MHARVLSRSLFVLLALVTASDLLAQSTTYYVNGGKGSDTLYDGLAPVPTFPPSSSGPFQTMTRAVQQVRLNPPSTGQTVRIYVAGVLNTGGGPYLYGVNVAESWPISVPQGVEIFYDFTWSDRDANGLIPAVFQYDGTARGSAGTTAMFRFADREVEPSGRMFGGGWGYAQGQHMLILRGAPRAVEVLPSTGGLGLTTTSGSHFEGVLFQNNYVGIYLQCSGSAGGINSKVDAHVKDCIFSTSPCSGQMSGDSHIEMKALAGLMNHTGTNGDKLQVENSVFNVDPSATPNVRYVAGVKLESEGELDPQTTVLRRITAQITNCEFFGRGDGVQGGSTVGMDFGVLATACKGKGEVDLQVGGSKFKGDALDPNIPGMNSSAIYYLKTGAGMPTLSLTGNEVQQCGLDNQIPATPSYWPGANRYILPDEARCGIGVVLEPALLDEVPYPQPMLCYLICSILNNNPVQGNGRHGIYLLHRYLTNETFPTQFGNYTYLVLQGCRCYDNGQVTAQSGSLEGSGIAVRIEQGGLQDPQSMVVANEAHDNYWNGIEMEALGGAPGSSWNSFIGGALSNNICHSNGKGSSSANPQGNGLRITANQTNMVQGWTATSWVRVVQNTLVKNARLGAVLQSIANGSNGAMRFDGNLGFSNGTWFTGIQPDYSGVSMPVATQVWGNWGFFLSPNNPNLNINSAYCNTIIDVGINQLPLFAWGHFVSFAGNDFHLNPLFQGGNNPAIDRVLYNPGMSSGMQVSDFDGNLRGKPHAISQAACPTNISDSGAYEKM